jgi:hypothetical protein
MTKRAGNGRSALFLLAASGVGLGVFGLPLLLSPLKWARRLRWRVPEDTALWPARDPWRHRIVFRIAGMAAALLAAVHVRGAMEGKQPWTETAEITLWAAMAIGAVACYPEEPEE